MEPAEWLRLCLERSGDEDEEVVKGEAKRNGTASVGKDIALAAGKEKKVPEWLAEKLEKYLLAVEGKRDDEWKLMWEEVLDAALEACESPQMVSALLAQMVDKNDVLTKCATSRESMIEVVTVVEKLLFNKNETGWNTAEKTVRFPALLNAFVGMCASEEGGGGDNVLCDKITSVCLRPDFSDEWARQKAILQQMFAMISQDIQVSTASRGQNQQPRRTIGVLMAWLVVWIGCGRSQSNLDGLDSETQLDAWASCVGTFAQNLFTESEWQVADELAMRCTYWVTLLEPFPVSSNAWFNLSIPLASALRRPIPSVASVLLESLEQVAWRIPSDALERLCFAPGGAMKQMVCRGVALEEAKRFYLKCADEQALGHDLMTYLLGKVKIVKGDEPWIHFELELVAERGIDVTFGHHSNVIKILTMLNAFPSLQLAWIRAFFKQTASCGPSLSNALVRFALTHSARGILLEVLQKCGEEISPVLLRACISNNVEDWRVRLAAMKASQCMTTLLSSLDDVQSDVRAQCAENIGETQKPVNDHTALMLELAHPDDHVELPPHLAVRYLENFLACMTNPNSDPHSLFQWLEDSLLSVHSSDIDRACAEALAAELVGSKLKSVFGNASATLSKLSTIIETVESSVKIGLVLEKDRLLQLAVTMVYFLEKSMFKAAENGSRASLVNSHAQHSEEDRVSKTERFFNTNRAVCSEWLSRIRPKLLIASRRISADLFPDSLWHGWQALNDQRAPCVSILKALASVLKARGEPEHIHDLLQWIDEDGQNSGALAILVQATALQSHGEYERASKLFSQVFESLKSHVFISTDKETAGTEGLDFLKEALRWSIDSSVECFTALSDWRSLDEWSANLEHLQEQAWSVGRDEVADHFLVSDVTGLFLARASRDFDLDDQSSAPALESLIGQDDSFDTRISSLQRADAVILSKLLGTPSTLSPASNSSKHLRPLRSVVARTISQALRARASLNSINLIQGRLWLLDTLSKPHGPQGSKPPPSELNSCPLPLLEMLRKVYRDHPIFHDRIVLAQVKKSRELGNVRIAHEKLLRVYNKESLGFIQEQALLDAQEDNSIATTGYLQELVTSVIQNGEMHSKLTLRSAEDLAILLYRSDSEEKRGFHLEQALALANLSTLNNGISSGETSELDSCHSAWITYGSWAKGEASKTPVRESELLFSAAEAFCRHVSYSTRAARNQRTVACLHVLEILQRIDTRVPCIESTPTDAWLPLLPQLLAAVGNSEITQAGKASLTALLVSITRNNPDRVIWDVFASRHDIPRDVFAELQMALPKFDLAEKVFGDLVGCAVWIEERWEAFLERILSQKAKTIDAVRTLLANASFDDDTKRDRCLGVMQPTLSALHDLYSATFGAEEEDLEPENEEDEGDDDVEEENDSGDEDEDDEDDGIGESEDEGRESDLESGRRSEKTPKNSVTGNENHGPDEDDATNSVPSRKGRNNVGRRSRESSGSRGKAKPSKQASQVVVRGQLREFQKSIKSTIAYMEQFMEVGVENVWNALELEHRTLQKWMKTRQSEVRLQEYAPSLFDSVTEHAGLIIPGTNDVLLVGFVDRVMVLNTKTRPKRIWARGSDGREYCFLLKGGEDMRVDQRIMQLGCVVNEMIAAEQSRHPNLRNVRGGGHSYRTFTVIPLSRRVGLVQWLNDAAPLLSIYRSWYHGRGCSAPAGGSEYLSLVVDHVSKKLGIDAEAVNRMQRKEWPQDALNSAFEKASSFVPGDLLARAIWLNAPDAASWWMRSRQYARSLAASSMLGYVVGLGDRHLDNILLDMSSGPTSGQVAHIDFAVCFEKGRLLRVPETVPFRLTKVMRGALPFHNSKNASMVGKEGSFASWSRVVLGSMRDNRGLIVPLISSLIHDKTIDWMSEEEKGETFSMDVNVSISLLASEVNLGDAPSEFQLEREDEFSDNGGAKATLYTSIRSLVDKEKALDVNIMSDEAALRAYETRLGTVKDKLNGEMSDFGEVEDRIEVCREEMLNQQRVIRMQQSECDRMQAQLANGVIGLQEEHVISRLRSSFGAAMNSLIASDGSSLNAAVRMNESKDSALLQASLELRQRFEDSLRVLETLRRLLTKYNDLRSYGSDSLVDTWLSWFQQSRTVVNETLEVGKSVKLVLRNAKESLEVTDVGPEEAETSSLDSSDVFSTILKEVEKITLNLESRVHDSPIAKLCFQVSEENLLSSISALASSCRDESIAWKNAQAFKTFWSTNQAFERSASVIEAVQARSDVRRALFESQMALNSAVEGFKVISTKWRASSQEIEIRRRVLSDVLDASKSLIAVLESVAKIEAQSKDLRTVVEVGQGSIAALDIRFSPLLTSLDGCYVKFIRSCMAGLKKAKEAIECRIMWRSGATELDRLRLIHQEHVKSREEVSDIISSNLRRIRRAAYLDHFHVWANISNIRRGADKDGPFFQAASALMEQRNSFLKRKHGHVKNTVSSGIDSFLHEVESLLDALEGIRKGLARLLSIAHQSEDDFGRREESAQEERKKRRDAMSKEVIRRLESKLDTTTDCAAQVDHLTMQAMSVDKLSRMYQGWMPFV